MDQNYIVVMFGRVLLWQKIPITLRGEQESDLACSLKCEAWM